MSSSTNNQQQQQAQPTNNNPFGGPNADLAARLAAPVSPTTEKSAAEARRRTSEWQPPVERQSMMPPRTFSFDREEHKRAMMAASGQLSGTGPAGSDGQGFTERG